MTKICTILIGAPGTGKSTWCEANVTRQAVVSSDNVIHDIADRYGFTYDEVFNDLIRFADKVFWDDLNDFAVEGIDIVVDRTNMSVKSRKKIIDLLRPYQYQFRAVVFPIPDQKEWKRRLDSRNGKTIPEHVLHSIAGSYTQPTENEGFSEIIFAG